ncbi:MAG: hypothetical protein WD431_24925 [Cyclobacteriaceae bacterium]
MRLIIALLLVFSLSTYVFATAPIENPIVTLEKVGENKFQMKYLVIPEGKVTVAIKDDNQQLVYKDVIRSEKHFLKNYDLNKLDMGSYHLEVFDTESGRLNDFDIHLRPANREMTYFAKAKVLDPLTLGLIIRNLNGETKTVEIYDGEKLIFEEQITGEVFGKKFKFENVKSLTNISIKVSDEAGASKYISAL